MTLQAIITLFVIFIMFCFLLFDKYPAGFVLFSALVMLMISGVLTPKEAIAGFSNEATLTMAALFIIVAAVKKGRFIMQLPKSILGNGTNNRMILLKLMTPVASISAFVNNTPLVALCTPIIKSWGIQKGKSPSKLLIPLAYAANLGGMCTLIGTSTNLIVSSFLKEQGLHSISMFELALIGVPCTIIGILYMIFIGSKLLPERPVSDIRNVHVPLDQYDNEKKSRDDFHSISPKRIKTFNPLLKKTTFSLLLFLLMIMSVAFGFLPILTASFICVFLLLLINCISFEEAKDSIEWNLILLIGSSFGIAKSIEQTGIALYISELLSTKLMNMGPILTISLFYLFTWICTELLTNNAAATLIIPIAFTYADMLGYNLEPFAITIAVAASASFATPIGYQTNIIVFGAGNYKFIDFLKVGIPLGLLIMLVTIFIVPWLWPL